MPRSSRTPVEMARCFNDRREALSLIHSAHVLAGLPSRSENALRVSRHQLLPRSRIFVAKSQGRIVSTLSLIPDSPAGLPLDETVRQSVDQVRRRGLSVAEVGCFAGRRQRRGNLIGNFCALLRYIAQYAHAQGIDCLLIGSHFGRAQFLKRYLGFHEEVCDADASAFGLAQAFAPMVLEFERLRVQSPEKYQAYFGAVVPPNEFSGGFMPRWEADYFGRPCATEAAPQPAPQPAALPIAKSPATAAWLGAHVPTLS